MEEQELKKKVQLLYGIKPREDWVILTRNRLVEEEGGVGQQSLQKEWFWGNIFKAGRVLARFIERPAFVMPALAFLVAGGAIWQGVTESLPGDALYRVKAAAEQVPVRFSAKEEQPMREFALARQRLADLKTVAEQNKVRNLPSAIQEFEENALRVSAGFVEIVENSPQNALQASRQIVQLQKEKLEVEKILGTKIGLDQEDDIENAIKVLVEYELTYLETRSLTQEQQVLFENAGTAATEGKYAEALEILWQLSQNE